MIYKNVKETRGEYETYNGVVDSSRGINMIVTKRFSEGDQRFLSENH